MNANSTMSRLLFRGVINFILIISSLLLFEFIAYILVDHVDVDVRSLNSLMFMDGEEPVLKFVKDPVLGYRLLNNNSSDSLFIDQWGGATTKTKQDDVFRIVCLGGSTTFGTCSDQYTNYPAQLKALFNQVYSNCEKRVEVINAGTMGYNSWHSLLRAQNELDTMQPDLYLVMDGLNDVITSMSSNENTRDQMEILTSQVNLGSHERTSILARLNSFLWCSSLYRFMHKCINRLRQGDLGNKSDVNSHIVQFGYQNNMEALIKHARYKGIGIALINYPWIVQQNETFAEANRRVPYGLTEKYFSYFQTGREYIAKTNQSIAKKWNIPLADPQPIIDTVTIGGNIHRTYCDSVHFTRMGNSIIASTVFNVLQSYEPLKLFLNACHQTNTAEVLEANFRSQALHPFYLGGCRFPNDTKQAFALNVLDQTGIRLMQSETPLWQVYTPEDPTVPGKIRIEVGFGTSSAELRIDDFNAIFYPRFSSADETITLTLWDGAVHRVTHPKGAEAKGWSEISERFGLRLPKPDSGTGNMEIEMTGHSQLWINDGKIFFFNSPEVRP